MNIRLLLNMNLKALTTTLNHYQKNILPVYNHCNATNIGTELQKTNTMLSFINENTTCLSRSCLKGHFTGSAFVLHPERSMVALTLHAKLNQWLQLGGHADNEKELHRVAMKEAQEESGMINLHHIPFCLNQQTNSNLILPFDIDIHLIPTYKDTPQHLHFDLRYLLISFQTNLIKNHESLFLKWFLIPEMQYQNFNNSLMRQVYKFNFLYKNKLLNIPSP